jgi:uncharacterized protein
MNKSFQIKILNSIQEIDKAEWSLLDHESPFTSYEFLQALEISKSTTLERGWIPQIGTFRNFEGELLCVIYGHIKNHSYGEYIFDWNLAQAYEQSGYSYYPKFCSSIPFSPVTTKKILVKKSVIDSINISQCLKEFDEQLKLNSYHHLFISRELQSRLQKNQYIPRSSLQYHWRNQNYHSFQDFLNRCTSSKRKMIQKERKKVQSLDLIIKRVEGDQLILMSQKIYKLYLSTIYKKGAIAYLNEDFFRHLFSTLEKNILLEIAVDSDDLNEPLAFSLFLYSDKALYGRYWGIKTEKEEIYPQLHFEMCYYRGIDFCIEKHLELFEAGAQGEHKISRGFEPTVINSAHKFTNPKWNELIENYMRSEAIEIDSIIKELTKRLPFKT